MLKFSEFFEFSKENSYFERIRTVRMVRMVRMVRSLADRTFQLCHAPSVLLVFSHAFSRPFFVSHRYRMVSAFSAASSYQIRFQEMDAFSCHPRWPLRQSRSPKTPRQTLPIDCHTSFGRTSRRTCLEQKIA